MTEPTAPTSNTTVNVTAQVAPEAAVTPPPHLPRPGKPPRQRSSDCGIFTRTWDWIDERQIDKHVVSLAILSGTIIITKWAMHYADVNNAKSGVEVAAVMAAILAPYMALQAAAISFYFRSRT